MRVFMVACFAVTVIALGAAAVLVEFVQESSATAFTEPSARIGQELGETDPLARRREDAAGEHDGGPLTSISPFELGPSGVARGMINRSCSRASSRSQLRTGPVSRWMKPERGYQPTPPRRIARAAATASESLAANPTSSARP
jgi:hypothetical protein